MDFFVFGKADMNFVAKQIKSKGTILHFNLTFIKLFNRLGIRVTGGSNIPRENILDDPVGESKALLQHNTLKFVF